MEQNTDQNVTRSQLSLWNYNQSVPGTLKSFLNPKERKNDSGTVIGQSVTVMPKKELSKATGLTKESLARKELEIRDELKEAFGREVIGLVASDSFTAGTARVSMNKDGLRTVNFSFKEVKKGSRGPSLAEIAKAYQMTEEQAKVMIERQLAENKANAAKIVAEAQAAAATKVTDADPNDPNVKPVVGLTAEEAAIAADDPQAEAEYQAEIAKMAQEEAELAAGDAKANAAA